jgi:hypothetical protein
MKARIVKRTCEDGSIKYVIQQKHFLLRFMWVDAWLNSLAGAACQDSFDTLAQAKKNLCHFDGSKSFDEVVAT